MKYNYAKFLQYTFFSIFILSFIIFIFLNYFGSNYPYFDHDTAFFSYMGRQLLNGYSFNEIVFDNKLFNNVIIYGLIDQITLKGQTVILSIIFYPLTALLILQVYFKLDYELFSKNNFVNFFFIFSIYMLINSKYLGISANSELISNFLIAFIIFLLIDTLRSYKNRNIILISFSTTFLFFFNTSAILNLALPLIYLFLSHKIYQKISFYISCLCGLFLFFLYSLIIFEYTKSDFKIYFLNFISFLPHYSDEIKLTTRLLTIYKIIIPNLIIFIPPLVFYLMDIKKFNSNDKVISLFALNTIFSIVIIGNPYEHYFSYFTVPITLILFKLINSNSTIFLRLIIIFTFLYKLSILSFKTFETYRDHSKWDLLENTKNKYNEKIDKERYVLSIKDGHIKHFLYDFKTNQKYLFFAHSVWVYSVLEQDYWIEELTKYDYQFISIKYQLCEDYKFYDLCKRINQNYEFDNELGLYKKI